MLSTLGLAQATERVYRIMLARPSEGFATIRELAGLTDAELRTQLDTLSELALVRPSHKDPDRLRAVSPEMGVKLILAHREAQLAAEQKRMEDARLAAAKLIAEFSQASSGGNGHIDHLSDIDEIRDRITLLCSEVRSEVMAFAPDGAQTAENMEAARPQDGELLERGIRMRTLYLDSLRNNPPTVAYATWLAGKGGQVRTVATLPVRMLLVDRSTAVIPMHDIDSSRGAVVLRGGGILAALCELFESVWARATPLDSNSGKERDSRDLTGPEAEALRLLSQGHTDETIAKRLGVSPRTARRIAADLMEKLDAHSRFQAGVKAALRGWINSDDGGAPGGA